MIHLQDYMSYYRIDNYPKNIPFEHILGLINPLRDQLQGILAFADVCCIAVSDLSFLESIRRAEIPVRPVDGRAYVSVRCELDVAMRCMGSRVEVRTPNSVVASIPAQRYS